MTAHKKLLLAILLFAVIGMIGLSTAVQGGVSNSPALNYTAAAVEPNPLMNVNATWQTFDHSYLPLLDSSRLGLCSRFVDCLPV